MHSFNLLVTWKLVNLKRNNGIREHATRANNR